jgi:hypothetical protein
MKRLKAFLAALACVAVGILLVLVAPVQANPTSTTTALFCSGGASSSIVSNFNGTPIGAGSFIWFSAVLKVSGVPSQGATVHFTHQNIQFTANGITYNANTAGMPDAQVTISPSATQATTTFDTATRTWITVTPPNTAGNIFLSGYAFTQSLFGQSGGLPGGISPVTWSGQFGADRSGLSVNWQWAAAVYTRFSTDNNGLGGKPVDDNQASQYKNSDHAGTPENFKSFVTGGARGGGGSNFTGSLSGTASVKQPQCPLSNVSPPTISGTGQSGQLLTADPGSWSGTTPISYAYQWRRCDTPGTDCADINGANAQTYTATTTDVGAVIKVQVTATDASGSAGASSAPTAAVSAPASASGDPVIAAAGDIACDPASSDFNGGLGTATACQEQATSNLLVGQLFAAVLALGDNQYDCGGYNAFLQSYDPTWGRVKSITHPVAGNHEYQTSSGTDCDATGQAGGYFQYFGPAAGDPTKGYYSFDVGSWHLIALNSNCEEIGGCGPGSPEETWLKADLAAHSTVCTLAYWHHPRFTSGLVGEDAEMAQFWQDLYTAGADVVLNGHAHGYERFAPQTPSETYDPTGGIREFVVGTGGEEFHSFVIPEPMSEAQQNNTFGILTLTLHATSYDWRFVPIAGATYSDSGSTFCH